ncbi:hypothetical protein FB451DRAFT_1400690 [Mycena latifolia]|nr:hypothetical protein FB451DRAFT_1400690 [Mycena latifolia]
MPSEAEWAGYTTPRKQPPGFPASVLAGARCHQRLMTTPAARPLKRDAFYAAFPWSNAHDNARHHADPPPGAKSGQTRRAAALLNARSSGVRPVPPRLLLLRVFSSVISANVAFRLVWLRHLLSGAEKRAATLEAWHEAHMPVGVHPFHNVDGNNFILHMSNSSYAKRSTPRASGSPSQPSPTFSAAAAGSRTSATHYHFIREIPMLSRYEPTGMRIRASRVRCAHASAAGAGTRGLSKGSQPSTAESTISPLCTQWATSPLYAASTLPTRERDADTGSACLQTSTRLVQSANAYTPDLGHLALRQAHLFVFLQTLKSCGSFKNPRRSACQDAGDTAPHPPASSTPITPFTSGMGTPSLGTGGGGAPEPDEMAKALLARGARQLESDSSLLYTCVTPFAAQHALRASPRGFAQGASSRCARRSRSSRRGAGVLSSARSVPSRREAYVPGVGYAWRMCCALRLGAPETRSAQRTIRGCRLSRVVLELTRGAAAGARAGVRPSSSAPFAVLARLSVPSRVPALCVILVRYARPRGPLSAPFVVRNSRAAELRPPAGRAIQCGFSLRGERGGITDRERLRSVRTQTQTGKHPTRAPVLARHTPQAHLHAGAALILRRQLAH